MGKAHSKGGLIDDSSDYHRRSFVLSSCSSSLVAISLLLHELPLLTGDFCHSPYEAMELQDLISKSEAADTKSQTRGYFQPQREFIRFSRLDAERQSRQLPETSYPWTTARLRRKNNLACQLSKIVLRDT